MLNPLLGRMDELVSYFAFVIEPYIIVILNLFGMFVFLLDD